MDRPIERKRWGRRKLAAITLGVTTVVGLGYVLASPRTTTRSEDAARLTVSKVMRGEFQEYVPIQGSVQPASTVYLDLEEGGIVEKIYIESGSPVTKGQLLVSFSNTAAQKTNIEAETRLIDNLNQLRNSKISLARSSLGLKDELLDLEYRINELEKKSGRFQQLAKAPSAVISREQWETTRDELDYLRRKRMLLLERIGQETALQAQQDSQIDSSIVRVNRNLDLLSRIVESLELRAPIDGHLSTLNAEVGQSLQRGQRVGQVDQLGSFKVRASVDQYYIAKVAKGQRGAFEFAGRAYQLDLVKIYPEVKEDSFQVDMEFVGAVPEGIKRGQTLNIDLSLSESRTTNMVEKGGFYRHTNGRWAYVLSADGRSARRVKLILGRQNPRFVEVLEGLAPGDRVVSSNYESFGDADELSFAEPVKN